MIGGGTTAIEAKLLGRNLICYDVNPQAISLTKSLLDFEIPSPKGRGLG
jgi:DNA modification methylase